MASIADVYVTVLPETGKIADGIKKALRTADDDVIEAAKRWKKEIEKALKGIKIDVDVDDVDRELDEVEKKARKKKPKVKVEPEIDKSAMDKLQDEADELFKRMEIDLDQTAMRNKFNKLRGDVEKSLSSVGVKLNERVVRNQLRQLTSELERLFGADNKISFEFDPARGMGNLNALFGRFEGKLSGSVIRAFEKAAKDTKAIEIDAEVSTKTAERQISKLRKRAEEIFDDLSLGKLDTNVAYTEIMRLRQEAERVLSGLEVSIDDSKAHAAIIGLERTIQKQHPTVTVDLDYDRDTLEHTAAQVSRLLSETMTEGITEVANATGNFLFDTLEKVARVHPLLTVGVVVTGAAAVVELTGVVASLTGLLGLIPGLAFAGGAAFGALKLATADFMTVMGDMADPDKFSTGLRMLGPQAQQAALSLKAIMDQVITPLKATLSESLFADLGPQLINTVNAIMPAITPGLTAITGAFNTMISQVMAVFQDPEMIVLVGQMMDNIGAAFTALAPALGLFVEALTRMGAAGSTFLPSIFEGITNAAQQFSDFITRVTESGEFQQWIQLALDTLQQIWPLVPSIVEAFMGLVPVAQAILPQLVTALQWFLATLGPISANLLVLGPNFSTVAFIMGPLAAIVDTLSIAFNALGAVFDVVSGKPSALSSAFQQHFPMLSGIVDSAASAISASLQIISAAIDAIMQKIGGFLDNPLVRLALGPAANLALPSPGAPAGGTPAPSNGPVPRGVPGPNTRSPYLQPGQPVPAGTPGAIVRPGTNEWMMPGTPPSPSGGREPQQILPPTPQNPYGLPTGQIPLPPLPPPKAPKGGGGGGGGGGASVIPGSGYTGVGTPDWEAIADAESGGNWQMNTGNGYFGGLQILQSTWDANGGQAAATRPDLASKADQIAVAENILQSQGPKAWPNTFKWKDSGSGGGGGGRGSRGGRGGYGSGYVPSDSGLQMNAAAANDIIAQQFPGITNIGGYRANGGGSNDHPSGHALDIMIPQWDTAEGKNMGDMVNQWLQQNAQALGLESTIWQDFWQPVDGEGHLLGRMGQGPDEAHLTHVHAKFGDTPGTGNYTDAMGAYSYDGPGMNRNNPMYTQAAKDTGGEQLGKDIVSGIGEIFGLGDLFKDPTSFGLFKGFKGAMEFGLGALRSRNGYGSPGAAGYDSTASLLSPGGGGAGPMGFLQGLLPQPFGALNIGSPGNAPGEFIPGVSAPGGGGNAMAGLMGAMAPGQQQGAAAGVVDNSTHFEGAQFGYSKTAVGDQLTERDRVIARQGFRSVPSK